MTEIAFGPFTIDLANSRIYARRRGSPASPAGVSGAARAAPAQRPRRRARPDDRGGVGRYARVAPHRRRDRRRGEEEPGRIRALDHAPAQGGLLPRAADVGGADSQGLALLGSPHARGRGAGDRLLRKRRGRLSRRLPRLRRPVAVLPDAGRVRDAAPDRRLSQVPGGQRARGGARRLPARAALQPGARPAPVRAPLCRGRSRAAADAGGEAVARRRLRARGAALCQPRSARRRRGDAAARRPSRSPEGDAAGYRDPDPRLPARVRRGDRRRRARPSSCTRTSRSCGCTTGRRSSSPVGSPRPCGSIRSRR